jgi:hypothetical protein
MKRERNTLVGTPTVLAPGSIYLVGGLGLPEEDVAVLAALSTHATAQYLPNVEPQVPLVADAVGRARSLLGESAAALPEGSVLLAPTQSQDDEGSAFDKSAATAVAATAAVFETAGQSIGERGFEILTVADAAYRAAHGGMGSEGELAAALHGGLIKVLGRSRIERLSLQPGFSVVVFQIGELFLSPQVLASLQVAAIGARSLSDDVLKQAAQLASSLSHRDVVAAIAAGRRYGQGLIRFATSVFSRPPVMFSLAAKRAEEVGGAAIPTIAGRGDIGVAIFATPEAATMFTRACRPPMKPMRLGLDREGARVVGTIDVADVATVVRTPMPEMLSTAREVPKSPGPAITKSPGPAIAKSPGPTPRRTPPFSPAGGVVVSKPAEEITVQRKVAMPETMLLGSNVPTRVVSVTGSPSPDSAEAQQLAALRRRASVKPVLIGALVATVVAAIWWAWPSGEVSMGRGGPPKPPVAPVPVAPAPREAAVVVQPTPAQPESPPSQPETPPPPAQPETPSPPVQADNPHPHAKHHPSAGRAHASAAGRRMSNTPTLAPAAAPAAPTPSTAASPKPAAQSPSAPTRKARAGKLTADDF